MMHRVSLLLGLAVVLALSVAAFGHNGSTQFVPEVPDPSMITINGDDDDWAWIDPAWATGIDDTAPYHDRWQGNKATHDFFYYTAWSRPPDNSWYLFTRVLDDTLRIGEEERINWWNDDMVQPAFDADHSGLGDYSGDTGVGNIELGQRYHARVLPFGGEPPVYLGQLDRVDAPAYAWSTLPPHFNLGWTLLPAGAGHLSENVTYTMEMKVSLWDFHGDSPDNSVRHVFAPDNVYHFWLGMYDGDGGDTGMKDVMMTPESELAGALDESQMADFWPLECDADCDNVGMAPTAVEHMTWGRIKRFVERDLGR